jgi:hypothetical protein
MQEITPQQEMAFQERMQQQQIDSNPNSVYADAAREEKIANVISQLNPELLLVDIEHRIRGEKKDQYSGQWMPISKDGTTLSELLVQNYVAFLTPYLTQNNSLSNYSIEEINNIMFAIIDYIRDDLTDNAELYGLTHKKEITLEVTVKKLVPYTSPKGIKSMKEISMTVSQKKSIGEEMTDYDTLTKIGHIVCQSTFSVLKQAEKGMLAARIFKALRVSENLNGGEKKGKLDFLKFW